MKIAIVGGGVSGLVTAHLLASHHDVQLFEADRHLGGHTCTVQVMGEGGVQQPVDLGFIVYNERNYPLFTRLLDELGVGTAESEMSFSVRCDRTDMEWNGSSLNQLFAQRSNLLRPSFYKMLLDILRFHREAPKLLEGDGDPTFSEFLEEHGFKGRVVDHYLVPMIAAVWSTDRSLVGQYPARSLFTFFQNHGLIQVGGRPVWRYVKGGSRTYVDRLRIPLEERIALGAPIDQVRRTAEGVEVKPTGQPAQHFDRVVLATHSDQALALLEDPTPQEREVLGAIRYQDSDVVLHTDASFLPRRAKAWASWNYHLGVDGEGAQLTYYMNRLQRIPGSVPYCVTLNRSADIPEEAVLETRRMAHPLYDHAAVRAQGRWQEVSSGSTLYCGAYWGHGFHEDGVRSAVRVADALGVTW